MNKIKRLKLGRYVKIIVLTAIISSGILWIYWINVRAHEGMLIESGSIADFFIFDKKGVQFYVSM